MKKSRMFVLALAVSAVCVAAVAEARCRGGWDGNGPDISGFSAEFTN